MVIVIFFSVKLLNNHVLWVWVGWVGFGLVQLFIFRIRGDEIK